MAGLYVHIPYCHAKCWYCDFFSRPDSTSADAYITALANEWSNRKSEITEPFKTLYLGGGTPSILPISQLTRLITLLHTPELEEITVEVNPEDVTLDLANALVSCGVNRVSMGVQSLVDKELQNVGRRHSARQAITAYETLRNGGIENISLDLIFGLPYQTADTLLRSLTTLKGLGPEHISAYALSIEQGTRLWAQLATGKIKEPSQELYADMYALICSELSSAGYQHYEISNFCRRGFESIHNSSYWNNTPYLGLGPAAHSFDGQTRRVNPADIKSYISHHGLVCEEQPETSTEQYNDYVMLQLRTSHGIDLKEHALMFGDESANALQHTAAPYLATGQMLYTPQGGLRISEAAWIVSDGIMADFMIV